MKVRMTVEELLKRQQPRRKVQGMAAALLPYELDGRIAVDAFAKQLISIHQAGLMNAVNMDTGYVNYLSDAEKEEVLGWTRQALGKGIPFVAGAYIEHHAGDDIVALYRRQIDAIVRLDGIPDPVPDSSPAREVSRKNSRSLSRNMSRLSPCAGVRTRSNVRSER